MAFVLDNKWRHGKARFDFSKVPPGMLARDGIVPVQVVLDGSIGSEMVLLLIDHTPFMRELAQVSPFNLMLKTGVADTAHGPVMFLLFHVPDPTDPAAQPVTMIDAHANPFDPVQMAWWRDLSRQAYWHVFLVGPGDEQAGFFEFANTFGLGEALDVAGKACAGKMRGDFDAAKSEFCGRFPLEDLFGM